MDDDALLPEEQKLAEGIVTEALLGNATGPERAAALKATLLTLKLMRRMVPVADAIDVTIRTLLKSGHIILMPVQVAKLRTAIERTGFLKGRGGNEQPATRELKDAIAQIVAGR